MALLSEIRFRLRALFSRGAMERELDAELRFHLDREVEKLVAQGVPVADAQRRARAEFGGVERIKDDARDERGIALWDSLSQDLRYAVRGLRARPAFSAGVILTLGLGIGANAAMFGVIDRVLFRSPPMLRDQATVHRLYRHTMTPNGPRVDRNLAYPTFQDMRRLTRSAFSDVAAFQTRQLALADGADAREARVTVASANYFSFFDASPAAGRWFSPSEDTAGVAPVVVLGWGYWQAQFGGRDVVGQQLRVGTTLATIVGVAPRDFVGLSEQGVPAAFIPLTQYAVARRNNDPREMENFGSSWLELLVRRRPDVSEAAAQAAAEAAFTASWRRAFEQNPAWGSPEDVKVRGEITPIQMGRGPQAGREVRVARWVSGVALIVLLIACANVANLKLARAVSRRREIAMRLALGVSRGRLVRQLLTESAVLAAAGGIVGLIVAQWGGAAIRELYLPVELRGSVFTDIRTLAFAALSTGAAAFLAGVVPAFNSGRGDVITALKAGEREGGERRNRVRKGLLVFQASLSVLLLVGAGLFVRSLNNARDYRLGYNVENVVVADVNMRGVQLDGPQAADLMRRFLESAQSAPGVTTAAMAVSIPFYSNEQQGLWVPGVDSVFKLGRFLMQVATPDYMTTLGTRILRGRALTEQDRAGTAPVMVVSEGMAKAIWSGEDAIGKCVRVGDPNATCYTVVGIAEEIRLRSFSDPRDATYYLAAAQYPQTTADVLMARTSGRAEDMVAPMRARLQALLPSPAYVSVFPMNRLVDPVFRAWKFGATMFMAFGCLALALAAIGLYSLIAYDVAQRQREMSVRIALGAGQGDVVRMVVARGQMLVGGGVLIGLGLAAWLAPRMESMLFHVEPLDPLIFGGVGATLMLVGVVATAWPALRASRVDPAEVLRGD